MRLRSSHSATGWIVLVVIALTAGIVMHPATIRAAGAPGDCPNDSKLLNDGPTLVFGSGAGTWWGLVETGLVAAGFTTPSEQLAYLNGVFGTSFTDLSAVRDFNLQGVETWDENGNGYVCAFELRGTRAYFGDPFINLTAFGISDDRLSKK